jgi:hypothetical protein
MKKEFNQFGLKHSTDFLQFIKPVIGVVCREYQALFVDAVTFSNFKDFTIDGMPNVEELPNANATAIGNLAYVALYHPDKLVRDTADSILHRFAKQEVIKAQTDMEAKDYLL